MLDTNHATFQIAVKKTLNSKNNDFKYTLGKKQTRVKHYIKVTYELKSHPLCKQETFAFNAAGVMSLEKVVCFKVCFYCWLF